MIYISNVDRQLINESSVNVRPETTFTPRDVEKHLNILNVLNTFSECSVKVHQDVHSSTGRRNIRSEDGNLGIQFQVLSTQISLPWVENCDQSLETIKLLVL